ncbi:MAG: kynureninase, partial [Eudoraea sp.]
MPFQNTLSCAKELDINDPLKKFRDKFFFPQLNGKNVIYFTGNSLGLQPKNSQDFVDEVMDD